MCNQTRAREDNQVSQNRRVCYGKLVICPVSAGSANVAILASDVRHGQGQKKHDSLSSFAAPYIRSSA